MNWKPQGHDPKGPPVLRPQSFPYVAGMLTILSANRRHWNLDASPPKWSIRAFVKLIILWTQRWDFWASPPVQVCKKSLSDNSLRNFAARRHLKRFQCTWERLFETCRENINLTTGSKIGWPACWICLNYK